MNFGAMLMVDDAHGTGVFGETGRGTPEMLSVEDRVDFWIGSAAKGLGVRGGFVAGPRPLMDYLRISSRRYVFSGTLPAGIPAAVSQALKIARAEPWRRQTVLDNARMLREGLLDLGGDVRGEGHIVPWFIGDDGAVDRVARVLEQRGVFASAIRFPAVGRGGPLCASCQWPLIRATISNEPSRLAARRRNNAALRLTRSLPTTRPLSSRRDLKRSAGATCFARPVRQGNQPRLAPIYVYDWRRLTRPPKRRRIRL